MIQESVGSAVVVEVLIQIVVALFCVAAGKDIPLLQRSIQSFLRGLARCQRLLVASLAVSLTVVACGIEAGGEDFIVHFRCIGIGSGSGLSAQGNDHQLLLVVDIHTQAIGDCGKATLHSFSIVAGSSEYLAIRTLDGDLCLGQQAVNVDRVTVGHCQTGDLGSAGQFYSQTGSCVDTFNVAAEDVQLTCGIGMAANCHIGTGAFRNTERTAIDVRDAVASNLDDSTAVRAGRTILVAGQHAGALGIHNVDHTVGVGTNHRLGGRVRHRNAVTIQVPADHTGAVKHHKSIAGAVVLEVSVQIIVHILFSVAACKDFPLLQGCFLSFSLRCAVGDRLLVASLAVAVTAIGSGIKLSSKGICAEFGHINVQNQFLLAVDDDFCAVNVNEATLHSCRVCAGSGEHLAAAAVDLDLSLRLQTVNVGNNTVAQGQVADLGSAGQCHLRAGHCVDTFDSAAADIDRCFCAGGVNTDRSLCRIAQDAAAVDVDCGSTGSQLDHSTVAVIAIAVAGQLTAAHGIHNVHNGFVVSVDQAAVSLAGGSHTVTPQVQTGHTADNRQETGILCLDCVVRSQVVVHILLIAGAVIDEPGLQGSALCLSLSHTGCQSSLVASLTLTDHCAPLCDEAVDDLAVFVLVAGDLVAYLQLSCLTEGRFPAAGIIDLAVLGKDQLQILAVVLAGRIDVDQDRLVAVDGLDIGVSVIVVFHTLNAGCTDRSEDHVALHDQAKGIAVIIDSGSQSLILGLHGDDLAVLQHVDVIVAVCCRSTGGLAGGIVDLGIDAPVQRTVDLTAADPDLGDLEVLTAAEAVDLIVLLQGGLLTAVVAVGSTCVVDHAVGCLRVTHAGLFDTVGHSVTGHLAFFVDAGIVVISLLIVTVLDGIQAVIGAFNDVAGDTQGNELGALLVNVGSHRLILGLVGYPLALAAHLIDVVTLFVGHASGLLGLGVVLAAGEEAQLGAFLVTGVDIDRCQLALGVSRSLHAVAHTQCGLAAVLDTVAVRHVIDLALGVDNIVRAGGHIASADHTDDGAQQLGHVTAGTGRGTTGDTNGGASIHNDVALQLQTNQITALHIHLGGDCLVLGLDSLLDTVACHFEDVVAVFVGRTGSLLSCGVILHRGIVEQGIAGVSSDDKDQQRIVFKVGVDIDQVILLQAVHTHACVGCAAVGFNQENILKVLGQFEAAGLALGAQRSPTGLYIDSSALHAGNMPVSKQLLAADGFFHGDLLDGITLFVKQQTHLGRRQLFAGVDGIDQSLVLDLNSDHLAVVSEFDGIDAVLIGLTGGRCPFCIILPLQAVVHTCFLESLHDEDVSGLAGFVCVDDDLIHNGKVSLTLSDNVSAGGHIINTGVLSDLDLHRHTVHRLRRVDHQCVVLILLHKEVLGNLSGNLLGVDDVYDQAICIEYQAHQVLHIDGIDQALVGSLIFHLLAVNGKANGIQTVRALFAHRHTAFLFNICFSVHVPIQLGLDSAGVSLAQAGQENGQQDTCHCQNSSSDDNRQQPLRHFLCGFLFHKLSPFEIFLYSLKAIWSLLPSIH